MDSLIYEKLKIDLHSIPAGLIKEYLQVRYWLNLASKPSFANLCRYKMAAQHLCNAKDFARLQQLCAEVPELKNLVMIPEPVENNEPTETAQSRCCDCTFYSGDSGNKPHHVMCAVNIPRPTPAAFRKVRGSLPDAWHDCPDFERASIPVLGGYSERSHTFEFDD